VNYLTAKIEKEIKEEIKEKNNAIKSSDNSENEKLSIDSKEEIKSLREK